jgi:hypothetical protein
MGNFLAQAVGYAWMVFWTFIAPVMFFMWLFGLIFG